MRLFGRFFMAILSIYFLFTDGEAMSNSNKYREGQIWAYKTRLGESDSKIYIIKIDNDPTLRNIYHVYIDKIAIKNPHLAGGVQNVLPHSPVSQKTLDESVTKLIKDNALSLPDISEGYKIWKEAFDKGQAGVFTISVDKIIQNIEDSVNGKYDNE